MPDRFEEKVADRIAGRAADAPIRCVAKVANHHAFMRCASTIGTSITSGGIGKNELSMKETENRA